MLKWLACAALVVAVAALSPAVSAYALGKYREIPPAQLLAQFGGPESRFLSLADGSRVHYRDEPGPADAPTIVLLHGGNASLHVWDAWLSRLRGFARLIRVDLPGHGLTGKTVADDYSPAAMSEFLDRFIATLGLHGAFVLVGNSMGGNVAWRYAVAHPKRITGLVLLDPAGVADPGGPQARIVSTVRRPGGAHLLRLLGSRERVGQALREVVFDPSVITPDMTERYWKLAQRPGTFAAMVARYRLPGSDPTSFARLASLAVPTLIMWGRDDRMYPLSQAHAFAAALADARLIIYEHCGHLPMEEMRDRSSADLRAFVVQLAPRAAAIVDTTKR